MIGQLEGPQLRRVQEELAARSWVIPWRAHPPVGAEALLALSDAAS